MKYFLLASFLNYLLPLSNRRKRKKYHQSFPLPVLVVPLFFTFAWRFSTKKKPTFWGCEKNRQRQAMTRTLAENSSSRMETSLRSWSLFYSCLENWISFSYIYTHIFGIPKLTSNWNIFFVWNVWNFWMDKTSQGFSHLFFTWFIHPWMTWGLRCSWELSGRQLEQFSTKVIEISTWNFRHGSISLKLQSFDTWHFSP